MRRAALTRATVAPATLMNATLGAALLASVVLLAPGLCAAGGVGGPDRPTSSTAIKLAPIVLESLDYLRQHSNGVVEYSYVSPSWMSPPLAPAPRPAESTAAAYMALNGADIGLRQPASDLRFDSIVSHCDGSETVVLGQTYMSIPIETARFELLVRDEIVESVTARFVANVTALPSCQPSIGGVVKYVTGTESSVVVVVVSTQVSQGELQRQFDACTGREIGSTYSYRP